VASEPIRCPFCSDIITADATPADYAYAWSTAILHIEGCPKRPTGPETTDAQTIAGTLIESHLNRYF